jgi:peroxiredoxin
MIKKVLFLGFILTSNLIVRPDITQISGRLPGAEGYEIRLLGYSDLITYTVVVIARTVVDTTGNFYLETDLRETTTAILDLDYYTANLVLEPGKIYAISCDSVDMVSQFRPFYEKDDIIFSIVPEDNLELNFLISTFNLSYNKFITDNFDNIYLRRKKGLIDTFRIETEQKYTSIDNPYFTEYFAYKIAQTELSAGSVNKAQLFKKFLDNKPVQYLNPEYMYFFNQFFNGYLTGESKSFTIAELENAINIQKSLSSVLAIISNDSLLKGERIRELVLLKTLNELYYNPHFYSENILYLIFEVSQKSEFTEHRLIATNIAKAVTNLQKGTKAPDFALPDLSGSTLTLSGFYGKPVYLSFLTTWTNACLAEFDLMEKLYIDYGTKINFITVSLDKDINTIMRYADEKKFEWTFLYNGTGFDLIHDYGIKTFPLFVLIDSEGRIFQYPAYKPSEIIEESLKQLAGLK